jgi:glutaredoxin 3
MLELYQFEGCPFCARVRQQLDDLGLDYLVRTVPHLRGARRRVETISGQTGVPVLVDPERDAVVTDSQEIADYLRAHYSGVRPGG